MDNQRSLHRIRKRNNLAEFVGSDSSGADPLAIRPRMNCPGKARYLPAFRIHFPDLLVCVEAF